ncbi:MAG: cob(I)yrinic acid a,c-diamide adenosyltransferase [Candidatus Omnitrophica bacterium]|nr:cob(I)yrinic acid a,c-diamide adenosyltransferase [Candidatus Omnitrophota bacterium]
MSIVTKTGDKSRTCLYRGPKLFKDHLRFEICGSIDELSAFLGLSVLRVKSIADKKILDSILRDLFFISTEAATEAKYLKLLKKRVGREEVDKLEKYIGKLEKNKKIKCSCFVFGFKTSCGSYLNIARTIARRTERRIVSALKKKMIKNKYLILYINRLSDLLFLIACKYQ